MAKHSKRGQPPQGGATPARHRGDTGATARGGSASRGTQVNEYVEGDGSGIVDQGSGANGTGVQAQGGGSGGVTAADAERQARHSMGDAGEGPNEHGTLSSGYSSGSSTGGTAGGVLDSRGSGYSPGRDSRVGAAGNRSDALAEEGVTAGAAGEDVERGKVESRERASGRVREHDEDDTMDGGASVLGVGGVSGGGSGTTRIYNTRK